MSPLNNEASSSKHYSGQNFPSLFLYIPPNLRPILPSPVPDSANHEDSDTEVGKRDGRQLITGPTGRADQRQELLLLYYQRLNFCTGNYLGCGRERRTVYFSEIDLEGK